ncbi:glutamic acid-rich protein-like [Trichoplusia ni]|uniref:Glutamic acid-rich protein-like n=1 Tax=Trichoplusia ni TaxID=7111 RepID=A0A7E5VZF9_TRINI|nr:glutamic acid-rich protein-like [Trichoplusia ni]
MMDKDKCNSSRRVSNVDSLIEKLKLEISRESEDDFITTRRLTIQSTSNTHEVNDEVKNDPPHDIDKEITDLENLIKRLQAEIVDMTESASRPLKDYYPDVSNEDVSDSKTIKHVKPTFHDEDELKKNVDDAPKSSVDNHYYPVILKDESTFEAKLLANESSNTETVSEDSNSKKDTMDDVRKNFSMLWDDVPQPGDGDLHINEEPVPDSNGVPTNELNDSTVDISLNTYGEQIENNVVEHSDDENIIKNPKEYPEPVSKKQSKRSINIQKFEHDTNKSDLPGNDEQLGSAKESKKKKRHKSDSHTEVVEKEVGVVHKSDSTVHVQEVKDSVNTEASAHKVVINEAPKPESKKITSESTPKSSTRDLFRKIRKIVSRDSARSSHRQLPIENPKNSKAPQTTEDERKNKEESPAQSSRTDEHQMPGVVNSTTLPGTDKKSKDLIKHVSNMSPNISKEDLITVHDPSKSVAETDRPNVIENVIETNTVVTEEPKSSVITKTETEQVVTADKSSPVNPISPLIPSTHSSIPPSFSKELTEDIKQQVMKVETAVVEDKTATKDSAKETSEVEEDVFSDSEDHQDDNDEFQDLPQEDDEDDNEDDDDDDEEEEDEKEKNPYDVD